MDDLTLTRLCAEAMEYDFPPASYAPLTNDAQAMALVKRFRLDATHVADWRDRRLQAVSSGSVRREINLMSAACTVAVREWKWLAKNPFLLIRKPADTKPRDRVISTEEMERLDRAATSPMQRHVMGLISFTPY